MWNEFGKKVTEGQSVESHSIDHLNQLISLWGDFQTTTAKDTASSEIKLPGIVAYDPNSSVNIAARISAESKNVCEL
jgi:Cu(I)/Ag(I) efflux system membrane fusion protein